MYGIACHVVTLLRHDTVQYGRLKCGRAGYCTAWYNLLSFCFFVAREALITFHGNFTLGGSKFLDPISGMLQPAFTQGFWGPFSNQLPLRVSKAHSPTRFHSGFPGPILQPVFNPGFQDSILQPAITHGSPGPILPPASLMVSRTHPPTSLHSGFQVLSSRIPRPIRRIFKPASIRRLYHSILQPCSPHSGDPGPNKRDLPASFHSRVPGSQDPQRVQTPNTQA